MVRISAEVTTPNPDRKFDGVFQISSEISPLVSPAFEAGRQSETEIILSRILEKTIRRSGALDTESLCIVAGSKCWAVRADVHVLVHDGNLIDASCIATVAALQHFRRPDVEVRGGTEVIVYSLREREPVPLAMQHTPYCVTSSIFGISPSEVNGTQTASANASTTKDEIIVIDASQSEELARDASVVVGIDRHGQVSQIAKYGGMAVDPLILLKCTSLAQEKVKAIHTLVQDALAKDAKARDAGGLIAELRAENDR